MWFWLLQYPVLPRIYLPDAECDSICRWQLFQDSNLLLKRGGSVWCRSCHRLSTLAVPYFNCPLANSDLASGGHLNRITNMSCPCLLIPGGRRHKSGYARQLFGPILIDSVAVLLLQLLLHPIAILQSCFSISPVNLALVLTHLLRTAYRGDAPFNWLQMGN